MMFRAILFVAIALTTACSSETEAEKDRLKQAEKHFRSANTIIPPNDDIISFPALIESEDSRPESNPDRNAYFGDLHVHTTLSFDGSAFGTTTSPADAYRYAQGEAIMHPSGFEMQMAQPLDFYAVTDHAFMLGMLNEAADTSTAFSQYDIAKPYNNLNESVDGGILELAKRSQIFSGFFNSVVAGLLDGTIGSEVVNGALNSAWLETVKAADAAYKPGTFTTFAAYEFSSSTPERGGVHRNVIFRGTERLPSHPFSRFNGLNPEDLWAWMDTLRKQDIESLAIPHNSNGSNGAMFAFTDWTGNAIDQEYADQRRRNEPLVEITQVKGTSETHPLLSPNDEWANFEIFPYRIATRLPSDPKGSYVRNAWLRGLSIEQKAMGESNNINPYKFGVIGSSDTHTGAASLDEHSYFGKVGAFDSNPEQRGTVPASFLYGTVLKLASPENLSEVDGKSYLNYGDYPMWGASGIAGVWAEENTREAIYDALSRKETFATSGTRIKVRFFAGYNLTEVQLDSPDLVKNAYQSATTMGGTLTHSAEKHGTEKKSAERQPTFLTWAVADPNTAKLQRVQIIKGWLENGEHQERVYDVACSDGLSVDPETHRCPDNGAQVNLNDCSITAGVGASELKTLWQDPHFNPGQEAFYYVRVLENPTCRWTTWDAIRAGEKPRSDLPLTIQERAWSSPIWYSSFDKANNFLE